MGWCKIGKDGAWYIADAIKYNEHVTTLDLRGNELGDEGARARAEPAGGEREPSALDLGYNEIKDNGALCPGAGHQEQRERLHAVHQHE